MRKPIYILYAFCFLLSSNLVTAQEMGLHFMTDIFQANKTNPAFMTEQRIVYTLPGFAFNFHHTASSYNDLIRTDANGQNILDLDGVIGKLKNHNIVRLGFDMELANTTFGTKIWRGSVTHALRSRVFAAYPKSLVDLGWNGNESFIGRSVNIAPEFQAMAYSELGLGFAMKLPKITVGGRVKILSGIFDISTGYAEAAVRTDEEFYQLHLSTFYSINSSSIAGSTSFDNFEPEFAMRVLSRNWGLAFDLGATMELSDKVTVAASLIDLGGINWNANVTNQTSQGAYTYEGLNIANILRDDELEVEQSLDTLEQIFDFQESNNGYFTPLPGKMYVSTTYEINKVFTAGGMLYVEQFRQRTLGGFGLNMTARVGKILTAGMTYSVFSRTYDNLGLNAAVKLGPFQMFVLTDNIIAMVRPFDSRNTNLRFGMNLAFK
ncbi:MAG: DUF5723 family protein [Bacteroidota bacterium]